MATLGHLFLFLVSCLIFFVGYIPQYFVFPSLHLPTSTYIRLNISIALVWITFTLAAASDPGTTTKDWKPNPKEVEEETAVRYCMTCEAFKPPRAHHCRTCGVCVMRMDHHCPWINNCVGYRNHAHFIRFLLYTLSATIQVFVLLFRRGCELWYEFYSSDVDATELVLLMLTMLTALVLIICLAILGIYQLWCVSDGITTIESWSLERLQSLVRRRSLREEDAIFPYDLGLIENSRDVFGGGVLWAWWVFGRNGRGTGTRWEVNEFAVPGRGWPPPDPDIVRANPHLRPWTHGVSPTEDLDAFRERQRESRDFYRYSDDEDESWDEEGSEGSRDPGDRWVNDEGETLEDYGIDVESEVVGFGAKDERGVELRKRVNG
ncbi:Palmitoyltransferase zdhhc6 [Saitoella coloradoensis]